MKGNIIYILKTDFSFYKKIFTKHGLKPRFAFLESDTCLNDIICSGHSDINLYNGRLHLALDLQKTKFYPPNIEDGKYNIPGIAKVRTQNEFKKYGSLNFAFECEGIKYEPTNSVYINNIGEVRYTSKCHFHRCFQAGYIKKKKFTNVSSILNRDSKRLFGNTKDQSFSSIPLNVGQNLKIDVYYNDHLNKIKIGDKVYSVQHRLKVNLYPYGLLGISVSYSITTNSDLQLDDIIALQIEIEKENVVQYKSQQFSNLKTFFSFIKSSFIESVIQESSLQDIFDLGVFTTINITRDRNTNLTIQELVGVLEMNRNYQVYSDEYVNSYQSNFGKYKNDKTLFKKDRLIYLFDKKWDYDRTRPLFSWTFSDVFFSTLVLRKLLKKFSFDINKYTESNDHISKSMTKYCNSINTFLNGIDHFQNLPSPCRKLFYKLSEDLYFDYKSKLELLQANIESYNEKSKDNHLLNYFTLNPNFMGIGVDLNKLFKKINMPPKIFKE